MLQPTLLSGHFCWRAAGVMRAWEFVVLVNCVVVRNEGRREGGKELSARFVICTQGWLE
jgi:hypothetical protein